MRRTKIIATLGPATDRPGEMTKLFEAGMDAARLNFSHGHAEDHRRRAEAVRAHAKATEHEVAIIADLQGPKIRIARFAKQSICLSSGDSFILDMDYPKEAGNEEVVGVDYENLYKDVYPHDQLLLDDGRVVLQVQHVEGHKIHTTVLVGGELSNNKGINRLGGGLSAEALTEKDKKDLQIAIDIEVDYVALSFPRSAQDVLEAKKLIQQMGGSAGVIAKIERAEAIEVIDEIITAADGVMVARGDLGVEIGDAVLPEVQKRIIQRSRALNKPVITATQMMETMITNAIPTRAEVFDVANAVLDGTDAVMLSGETASGKHPAKVVEAMARICMGAEKHRGTLVSGHRVECSFEMVEESIAMAAMYTANHFKVSGIVAFTESGLTPLLMSRIRSGIPIFGLTPHARTQRKMSLYRGVYPISCVKQVKDLVDDNYLFNLLKSKKLIERHQYLVLTHGDYMGKVGSTNTMRIIKVE